MAECVFCDIVHGKAPASVVYADEIALAFLDLFPVHEGHCLVIPKEHSVDLVGCASETAGHLMRVAHQLAPQIARAVGAHGFNVWIANGAAAGQDVFHVHLHILPRFENDSFGLRFPASYPREAPRSQLDLLAERISETE